MDFKLEYQRRLYSPHRGVQLQSIRKLLEQCLGSRINAPNRLTLASPTFTDQKTQLSISLLWECVASSKASAITTSAAASSLILLTKKGVLGWFDSVNGFVGALDTMSKIQLDNAVKALFELFVFYVESGQAGSPKDFLSSPFTVSSSRGKTHPLIVVASAKEETWDSILSGVEHILKKQAYSGTDLERRTKLYSGFELIKPFIDFVLLSENDSFQSWRVTMVNVLIRTYRLDHEVDRGYILRYLVDVLRRIPTPRVKLDNLRYLVTDLFVQLLLEEIRENKEKAFQTLGIEFVIETFATICSMSYDGLSTLSLLSQIRQLMEYDMKIVSLMATYFNLLFPIVSYLLLDAPSSDHQEILLYMLASLLESSEDGLIRVPFVCNTARFPLIQVLTEGTLDTLKDKAVQLLHSIETLEHAANTEQVAEEIQKSRDKAQKLNIRGIMAYLNGITVELSQLYTSSSVENLLISTSSSEAFHLSNVSGFCAVPFAFHPDQSTRVKGLSALVTTHAPKPGTLGILPILLYVMRNQKYPEVEAHIIHHCFPRLVESGDPFVISKIVQVSMTIVQKGIAGYNTLYAVGIRGVYALWRRQPRVWRSLRNVLSEWTKQRKQMATGGKTIESTDPKYEIEIAALATMSDICKHKGHEHGHEIFPMVSSLVQFAKLSSQSLSLALATINECIQAGVAETRPVWNVLLLPIAKKAMETTDRLVLIQLAGFYSIVAKQSDGSEDFVLFKSTLLSDYIKPLIFPEEEGKILPKDLQKAVISCLAKFEASEIFPILPETPRLLVNQIIDAPNEYHELLLTLMQHEIRFMRRTMFKGTIGKGAHKGNASGNEKLFESLTRSGERFTESWKGGKVLPGLRVGYALASLFCFGFINEQEKIPFSEAYPDYHSFKSSKPYRFLTDGIQDISLTDHLVTRLSIFEAWFSLFSTTFEDPENDGTFDTAYESKHKEAIMDQLVTDLLERLENSRVPKTSCNIVAALTGLIRNMHYINSSSATSQTRRIIHHLRVNIVDQPTSQSVTDDTLFSAYTSIAILTGLIPSDEKLLVEISGLLISGLQASPMYVCLAYSPLSIGLICFFVLAPTMSGHNLAVAMG
ncbi:hypothetical protein K493DRAFT_71581 [Basidiobolus meristosporus CBS 931.73]|uniref:DUF3730 domain-containing protein n=1 Tax=Basidiobolus meristosporus CBS 931.73 TaxID=1314790 RepID=A0A1Y1XUD6_9FUNG|nr:hypothetical protein K493DRAFT_71581 [Basidiobolus meristosporus CBS 931.73]|eukprot:ORX89106.1 hypothetical protein K493DRAFT_71581 [Basidiobolus meristosporus CBS 931.73]